MIKIIIGVIVVVLLGAGVFVWYTWPRDEEPEVVITPEEPIETTRTFSSQSLGYSLTYPVAYTQSDHTYEFSPTKNIEGGFKVTVPLELATGTNLSSDSYLAVEQLPNARNCTGDIFMRATVKAGEVEEGGVTYWVASSTEAAAGNRYEEWMWALDNSAPCTAVRYYIHSTAIENYPEGTVREFNREALLQEFDSIRQSLRKI
ncbi:MAG: hypothetical protein Q8P58_02055 [Candidatus Adlerbacteria bacterium]|nr:hypothetical protein [Candidatus Adlerbacteria bacterium]MDZ4226051.1 hypothetical protein [Patescibacteria group bacterium]